MVTTTLIAAAPYNGDGRKRLNASVQIATVARPHGWAVAAAASARPMAAPISTSARRGLTWISHGNARAAITATPSATTIGRQPGAADPPSAVTMEVADS